MKNIKVILTLAGCCASLVWVSDMPLDVWVERANAPDSPGFLVTPIRTAALPEDGEQLPEELVLAAHNEASEVAHDSAVEAAAQEGDDGKDAAHEGTSVSCALDRLTAAAVAEGRSEAGVTETDL